MFDILKLGSEGWGDELLFGAWITVQLASASLGLGLILGLLLAGGKLSSFPPLRWICHAYTLIIRGVPEFLIIMIVFFGSERMINSILKSMGFEGGYEISPFLAATVGLAMIFGAYSSEVFRGAFEAVPKGQMEAAKSVGMSNWQAFSRIRFKQMWRFAIPGLGNLWMVLIKDTSLAAVIALEELLRVAKLGGESEQNPLAFFAAAGILYLIMTALSDIVRAKIEKRARRGFVSL